GGDPAGGDGVLDHQQLQDGQPQVGGGTAEPLPGGGALPSGQQQLDHLRGVRDDVGGVPVEGGRAGHRQQVDPAGVLDLDQTQVPALPIPGRGGEPAGGDAGGAALLQGEEGAGEERSVGVLEARDAPHGPGEPVDDPAQVASGGTQVFEQFPLPAGSAPAG